MRYKTLFRVLLKVLGVWLIFQGLLQVIQSSLQILVYWLETTPLGVMSVFQWVVWPIYGVIELLFGLYLFFGGSWIADKAIPGNRPYCHECGYDLRSATGPDCPECGTPLGPPDVKDPGDTSS